MMIFNFEVTDGKVRRFTVILMFKKLPKLIGKKAAGWQALPPSIQTWSGDHSSSNKIKPFTSCSNT